MRRLENKIVLVTGASSGIGAACARAFAEIGARLILVARRKEKLDQLAVSLKNEFNSDLLSLQLDVRDRASVEKTFATLPESWQNIDILINNAGLASGMSKIHEGDIDDWEKMIDTNVKGLLYVSRTIIPGMVDRNQGHIINIGSIAGHEVYPNGNVYCATKHAVDALTKGMRIDLLGTNIRVSTLDPGMVETEFSIVRFHGDKSKADSVYQNVQPLTGVDIADAAVYCATRPAHVQVAEMILFPTAQRSATTLFRKSN